MTQPTSRRDGSLTAHTGFWLRFVSNHVSASFRQKLATKDVAIAEWVLMRSLYDHEDMPPSDLAIQLGMTRGGITKLVDKLQKRSLVSRTPDTNDRRSHKLSLTSDGRRLVLALTKLAEDNEREWFGHLPAATIAALDKILRDIVDHHQLRTVPIE